MGDRNRPISILWFERLFWFGLILSLVDAYFAPLGAAGFAETEEEEIRFLIASFVIVSVLNLLLLWLIAYRASNIGKWIFIVLVGVSFLFLPSEIQSERAYPDWLFALMLAQYLLCVIEVGLLFRRDSRDWFDGIDPVDANIFS